MNFHVSVALGMLALGVTPRAASPRRALQDSSAIMTIFRAEDARPTESREWAPILGALRSENPTIRAFAVRALGRLETPSLASQIEPLLADPDPAVRIEAYNAMAQAVFNADPRGADEALLRLMASEQNAVVLGAAADAIGRMSFPTPERAFQIAEALLAFGAPDAAPHTVLGVAKGVEWLVRTQRGTPIPRGIVDRLGPLAEFGSPSLAPVAVTTRRLGMAALVTAGGADVLVITTALEDPDPETRRLAIAGLATLPDSEAAGGLLAVAMADQSGTVRIEALRVYGRRFQQAQGCAPVLEALNDLGHVQLLAIDLLGNGCPSQLPAVRSALLSLIEAMPDSGDGWHGAAHSLVSLARLDAAVVAPLLDAFTAHPTWQVRMYAARAAAATGNVATLESLAYDAHHNVRTEAIQALSSSVGHGADSTYLAALGTSDYQLLLTAAGALEASPRGEAVVPALLEALQRTTTDRRQTSRDARRALLERAGALGSPAFTDDVRQYLTDFDPVIAELAAVILRRWTGASVTPTPRKPALMPFPTFADLDRLRTSIAIVHMRGGERFAIELFPFEAPTNAARFVRLAQSGYFDGLTFHRVVPNFVIQGGSPGANEFHGDGPFTRDELTSRSHLRGTVGISTRGRDTGDAQIFVNLVDNIRLDHNYTIFGQVVGRMEAVDAVLEGAVIERIEIVER